MLFKDLIAQLDKKYRIWESFYKNEIVGLDGRTKQPVTFQPPFNGDKASYDEWQKKTRDPITGEFYKVRTTLTEFDDDGKPKTKQTVETEPFFKRNQIVRVRTPTGKEYVYSRGLITGATQLGNIETMNFQQPELWVETQFKRENRFMPKENRYREIAIGPNREVIHYSLPWNPDNVDKLMEDVDSNVRLVITEEGVKNAIGCPNLETFKTKSFDYIKNADWLTAEQKEQKRKESEALQETIIAENKKKISTAAK